MEPKDLSGALRTVLNILDAWHISPQDRILLLGCDQDTYNRWINTRQLGEILPDTLERLSYILGIWKALQVLHPNSAATNTWVHRPNSAPEFNGETPLSVMARGQLAGLSRVRRHLDAWCN